MKSLLTYSFILFLLLISIPSQVFSQKKLINTHSQTYSNGSYSPFDSVLYQYNTNGKIASWHSKYYDKNTSTWKNLLNYEYTYNANGDVASVFVKLWSDNKWKDNSVDTYLYDSDNRLKTLSTTRWYNNQWNNGHKTEYHYNSNSKVPDSSIYYNYSNNSYSKSVKNIYSYNLDNKVTLEIDLFWEKTTGIWIENSKKTYFYNTQDLNYKTTTATKAQIGWSTIFILETSYDSDGDIIKIITKDGNEVITRRTTYAYDSLATKLNDVTIFKSSVYPNPAKNYCMLSWDSKNSCTIKITDNKGKTIKAFDNIVSNTLSLNVTHINSGLYYYIIEDNSTHETSFGKLIIQ